MTRIVLDINGIYKIKNGVRTGIPRVEFAVFNYLLSTYSGEVAYLIDAPTGDGFYRADVDYIFGLSADILPRSRIQKLRNSISKRIRRQSAFKKSTMNGSFEAWKDGDCYLSVSNLWERISSDEFFALRARGGLKIALFCHDLAPIIMPHLYTERARTCFSWCLGALSSADLVICNSFFTQYELLRLMNLKGQSVVTRVVQLNAKNEVLLEQQEVEITCLKGRLYVLSVSSINNRKNYELLLKLWSVYELDLEIRDVCLVIVGSKTWGAERVFHRLEMDISLSNRVFHFSDVSENTLDWLYQNCLFTVYPSLYEGWGIPITESLSYGKVCVASSTSSMPEASSGLGVHIDPLDFVGWKEGIKKLITDHGYRRSMEKFIQEKFVSKDWNSVGKEVIERVLEVNIDLKN